MIDSVACNVLYTIVNNGVIRLTVAWVHSFTCFRAGGLISKSRRIGREKLWQLSCLVVNIVEKGRMYGFNQGCLLFRGCCGVNLGSAFYHLQSFMKGCLCIIPG